MVSIELVYDAGCPKVEEARRNVKQALKNLELPATWTEWERSSPFASWARQFDSPTILVNSDPILDTASAGASNSGSLVQLGHTAPSVQVIEAALARAMAREHAGAPSERAGGDRLTKPVVLVLLPLSCCLPLVLASLSSLSLGGVLSMDFSFPLVAGFLGVALAILGLFARRTRRYGPLVAGVVAAGAIMLDRLALFYRPMTFGGVAVLVGASVWVLASYWHKASACSPNPSKAD